MEYISPQIVIRSVDEHRQKHLYFKFRGKFTEGASKASTEAWDKELKANPDKHYQFTWDCTDMEGFEFGARKEWYKCMALHKKRLSHVNVISGNILIRGAARVMLEFFGIPGTISRSTEKSKRSLLAEAS